MAILVRNKQEILNAVGIGTVIEESDLFYQEFSSTNDVQLNGNNLHINLDVDEVDFLIVFPLTNTVKGNYAFSGGIYVPDVFGRADRTSYGNTGYSIMGCGVGTDIFVNDGVLTISKTQSCIIFANTAYGIIGKARTK